MQLKKLTGQLDFMFNCFYNDLRQSQFYSKNSNLQKNCLKRVLIPELCFKGHRPGENSSDIKKTEK